MEIPPEIYNRYLVEKALRRSHVKRRIVMYLSVHGFGYISEIAREICVTPTNVIGAIKGMDNRYLAEDSLLSLGVVDKLQTKRKKENVKMFCLTSVVGQNAVLICRKFDKEGK
jgi:predicted transcriptional regulator with HTH domain